MNHRDVIVEENFFNHTLIGQLWKDCLALDHNAHDFIDHYGIWKGRRVSRQNLIKSAHIGIDQDDHSKYPDSLRTVIDMVNDYFDNSIAVREIAFQQLYLPWDIHCDLTRQDIEEKNVYTTENRDGYVPFYNVLIPLHDVNSRTVVFDQTSTEYNDFYLYKQNNPQVENPLSEEAWNEYLSMTWPEDRLWLTVKQVLPAQCAGQLIAFRRHFFHSSDNFHTRGVDCKHFVQLLLDKKNK
jgi:hypothetical protein